MATQEKAKRGARLDAVDIAKFILSIFVVFIHINPFGDFNVYAKPLLRTAVPLFFLISAFFFFRKQRKSANVDEKIGNLFLFAKRNLQLYAFWLVVLFVPTAAHRDWFDTGLLYGVFRVANDFMFHSTFIASWYIMASVIATFIVVLMSLRLSNKVMFILFLPIYVICCLMSNYCYAPAVESNYDALAFAFSTPYNSFWVALMWILIGKAIADNEDRLKNVGTPVLAAIVLAGLLSLAAEQAFIVSNGYSWVDDCYFSLPLVCVPAFLLLLRVKMTCSCSHFLRAASTITYCFHDTLNVILRTYFDVDISNPSMVAVVLVASWLLTLLILRVEKIHALRILKYSH